MSKIINIQDHIELEKQKKLEEGQKRQVEAVRKVILCSSCRLRCSRCGVQVATPTFCPFCSDLPFNLCPTCAEEYDEYKRSLDGLKSKDIPWHNQEWEEMWQRWLEYQKALKKYQQSREIRELLKKD